MENLKLAHQNAKKGKGVFPTFSRGIDFVGYRIFLGYSLLRKTTCKQMKVKMVKIRKKVEGGQEMNHSEWCSINSYKGWLMHCDSYRLSMKYIEPIQKHANDYYIKNIKRKAA